VRLEVESLAGSNHSDSPLQIHLHQTANPELAPSSLGPQMNGLAKTRGEQIQQGQESGETLTNDINAREAKCGFTQAGRQ